MPDLGKYAVEVLLAYGLSLGLLVGLCLISVIRARRVLKTLRETENRRKRA